MPCGGIARTFSLRSTRSQVAASFGDVVEAGRLEVDRIVGRQRVPRVVAGHAVLLDPGLLLVDVGRVAATVAARGRGGRRWPATAAR